MGGLMLSLWLEAQSYFSIFCVNMGRLCLTHADRSGYETPFRVFGVIYPALCQKNRTKNWKGALSKTKDAACVQVRRSVEYYHGARFHDGAESDRRPLRQMLVFGLFATVSGQHFGVTVWFDPRLA